MSYISHVPCGSGGGGGGWIMMTYVLMTLQISVPGISVSIWTGLLLFAHQDRIKWSHQGEKLRYITVYSLAGLNLILHIHYSAGYISLVIPVYLKSEHLPAGADCCDRGLRENFLRYIRFLDDGSLRHAEPCQVTKPCSHRNAQDVHQHEHDKGSDFIGVQLAGARSAKRKQGEGDGSDDAKGVLAKTSRLSRINADKSSGKPDSTICSTGDDVAQSNHGSPADDIEFEDQEQDDDVLSWLLPEGLIPFPEGEDSATTSSETVVDVGCPGGDIEDDFLEGVGDGDNEFGIDDSDCDLIGRMI